MEEFLPGLVKVMEERFGRFGRPFTTLLVGAVGLAVLVWSTDLIYGKAIGPAIDLLGDGTPSILLRAFRVIGSALGGYVVGYLFVDLLVMRPRRKRLDQYESDLAAYTRLVEELQERLDSDTSGSEQDCPQRGGVV